MSLLWIEKLAHWLEEQSLLNAETCALDYGCGYFDLGRQILKKTKIVDGYDPNENNFPLAKELLEDSDKIRVSFYSMTSQIPHGKYDLIVLNSVVQYFAGKKELEAFFAQTRQFLRTNGKIVLADLIPENYNRYLDALEGLAFAMNHGVFVSMVRHLYRSVTKPNDLVLYQLNLKELADVASSAGWRVKPIENNLTPSRRRYSVICESQI